MAQELPYSTHTFILPFVWKGRTKYTSDLAAFARIFEANPFWTEISMKDENSFPEEMGLDIPMFYAEYQFFYPQVRSAVYGYNGIVRNFVFAQEQVHNKAHYFIEKYGKTYDLQINQLRLRLYNTGIGLICMECENYGTTADGKPQNTFSDVKNINDFGRRINLPFLPNMVTAGKAASICADTLVLAIPELNLHWKTDFNRFSQEMLQKRSRPHSEQIAGLKLNYIVSFLKELLGYGSDFRFTSDSTDREAIYIYPALDDRMFVASIVTDPKVTQDMLGSSKTKFAFTTNQDLNKSLYEFFFVDPAGSCTCSHEAMRHELLGKHLYRRWLPDGSFYGITAQGFMLLHDGSFLPNITSFLTIYMQIVYLCLAQLASMIVFQKETADLAARIHKKRSSIKVSTVTDLMDLQERFSAFEGQFCFDFVTSEEQGIELYEMFQEFFFIDRYLNDVKSQMDGIHEATDTYLDFNFNKIGYIFTFVGAILSIAQVYYAVHEPKGGSNYWFHMVPWLVLCVLAFFAIRFIYRRKRR